MSGLAYRMQNFQDWFTQQWAIIWGRKIDSKEYNWLHGPFGETDGIGEDFIAQLAERENLAIKRNCKNTGLLSTISKLNFAKKDLNKLSKRVIDFYENTSEYKLEFAVSWNPYFKFFGFLVNTLFSQRINQLNIPTSTISDSEALVSEIIQLVDPHTQQPKYTIWLRKFAVTNKVIYSGVYGTCILPNGKTCIKAVFPLPKGNATVIMNPSVGENNELILDSSGKKFGDAGFYFLLNDTTNSTWGQYISSFTDQLVVFEHENSLLATQTLKLWNIRVVTFNYQLLK